MTNTNGVFYLLGDPLGSPGVVVNSLASLSFVDKVLETGYKHST